MERTDYVYDVFISHAVEDKMPIANELYKRLLEKDLKVWYSGTELGVGDRLTDSIYKNLDKCRFGVVIISPTYLSKIWALAEFFLLLTKEKDGAKVILPVLYDITPAELASRSTLMAEIFAVHADKGLEFVTDVLVREIRKTQEKDKESKVDTTRVSIAKKGWIALLLTLLLTLGGYGVLQFYPISPGNEIIEQAIQKRISELQKKADVELQEIVQTNKDNHLSADVIKKEYAEFINTKSYYRNEYVLNTGLETIRSKKNVEAALAVDLDTLSPFTVYAFTSPEIYRCDPMSTNAYRDEKYAIKNIQAVTYTLKESKHADDQYQVVVQYTNPIRLIVTSLTFPTSPNDIKRYQLVLTALRPVETYTFTQQDKEWVVAAIQ